MTPASIVCLLALSRVGSAFTSTSSSPAFGLVSLSSVPSSPTALAAVINPTVSRAVQCAKRSGYCDVEEMAELAQQLKEFDGFVPDNGHEASDKQIQERKDVAEMLEMIVERQLRMEFVDNTVKEPKLDKPEQKKEEVAKTWVEYEQRHGMGRGLGLW